MDCIVHGCDRKAALLPNGKLRHGGKCHGHARRQTKAKPMSEPLGDRVPPAKRLELAAIDVGNAGDDDSDHRKALKRLYMAAVRLKRHRVQKSTNHPRRG